MTITRINEFKAADGKADEMFQFLQSLIPFISDSAGNEGVEVLRATDAEDECVVIEKWQSEEMHKASLANFPQHEMQAAMVLFAAPPKGRYLR